MEKLSNTNDDLTMLHLICDKDLDCNKKISNSYCNKTSSKCSCERGYRYYSVYNRCIFSNHFHCNAVEQCASLDPRLTCVDNYCTCKERSQRTDSYLCTAFRKYCYKGYRYNVDTTDCVFVGDLTMKQLENFDQSVEIFVIVLFFITSALFIASCINNYQNERREKLRRRIAQQQTMSIFAEQRRRLDLSPSISEVINLTNNDNRLFANHHNHNLRNDSARLNASNRNQLNHNYRYPDSAMMDYHKSIAYEDLPPSYDQLFPMKTEELKYNQSSVAPSTELIILPNQSEQQIHYTIIEQTHYRNDLQNHLNNSISNLTQDHQNHPNNSNLTQDHQNLTLQNECESDPMNSNMNNDLNHNMNNDLNRTNDDNSINITIMNDNLDNDTHPITTVNQINKTDNNSQFVNETNSDLNNNSTIC